MSNINTETKTYALPITQNYRILSRNDSGIKPVKTYLTWISSEEEEILDNLKDKSYILTKGTKKFKIHNRHIICYGEIDFNKPEDVDLIKRCKFLNYLQHVGIPYPLDYDYNSHTCKAIKNKPLYTETWNALDVIKFAHASLNKPARILIFNQN